MNVRKSLLTAAVVAALGAAGSARAADFYPPAAAYGALPVPVVQGESGCPSCGAGQVLAQGCASCGSGGKGPCDRHAIHLKKNKAPFQVTLCPGACFGYFQTQWRRWEEVCPYPYQGVGVSDAPRPPAPYLPAGFDQLPPQKKTPQGGLPEPRPVKSKTDAPVPPGGGAAIIPPLPNVGN